MLYIYNIAMLCVIFECCLMGVQRRSVCVVHQSYRGVCRHGGRRKSGKWVWVPPSKYQKRKNIKHLKENIETPKAHLKGEQQEKVCVAEELELPNFVPGGHCACRAFRFDSGSF